MPYVFLFALLALTFLSGMVVAVHRSFAFNIKGSLLYVWEEILGGLWSELRYRNRKVEDNVDYEAMRDYAKADVEATARMFRSDKVVRDDTWDVGFDAISWIHSEMKNLFDEELARFSHIKWLDLQVPICTRPEVDDFVLVSVDGDKPRCPNCAEILTKRANGVS